MDPHIARQLPHARIDRALYNQLTTLHQTFHPNVEASPLPTPPAGPTMRELQTLIPKLLEAVVNPNDALRWLAGHLLYHLRDRGAREPFQQQHGISLDLFATGMNGRVILRDGRLVEASSFHGWAGH